MTFNNDNTTEGISMDEQSPSEMNENDYSWSKQTRDREAVEQARTWLRTHKDELLIGAVLVLGYKHRRLAKKVNKMLNVNIEHAKVTKQLAENAERAAKMVDDLGHETHELFRRSEMLYDAAVQHRDAINQMGKVLKK